MKNKLIKILSWLLTLLMLAGCGSVPAEPIPVPAEPAPQVSPSPTPSPEPTPEPTPELPPEIRSICAEHELPVLMMTVDDTDLFGKMVLSNNKEIEVPGSLALYENGAEVFSRGCGISLKGFTSLNLPKKSFGVYFRKQYGDGKLKNCDLFDSGVDNYSSLSLRVGQDWTYAIIRNELMQELCLQMTDKVLTQHSKYCVLYVNNDYYGLYCLKENLNEQFYSHIEDVSKDSVVLRKTPLTDKGDELYALMRFPVQNDMSVQENADEFFSKIDRESLIDWIILEGYCANTDLLNNIRWYMSPEVDGKYHLCFFDLDWSFTYVICCYRNVFQGFGNPDKNTVAMIQGCLKNESFRTDLIRRFAEVIGTTLSDENVLSEIDYLYSLTDTEIEHDLNRWGGSFHSEQVFSNKLKEFISNAEYNYSDLATYFFCRELHVTPEEMQEYFGTTEFNNLGAVSRYY